MTTTANDRQGHRRAQHGLRPAGAEPPRRLRPARPDPHPQAGRARALPGRPRTASARRPPPAAPSRPPSSSANRRARSRASRRGLFDITPDDEQQMFQEAGRAFAEDEGPPGRASRPTPSARRRRSCSPRPTELGVNMLGVPEELGGVMHEQAAVTSVLIGEALAHGDMGIAYAALAPGAVATAIGHWGSAEQEATYLPAFTGEDVPAAALAILEPRPLFDPLKLETEGAQGRRRLGPRRRQVAASPAPRECELFVDRRRGRGHRPGAVRRSSPATDGLSVEPEPAMGLRPAATGRLLLEDVSVPGRRAARRGQARGLRRVRATARGSPGARSRSAPRRRSLDYVIPYVNERQRLRRTDLQPPGRRLRGLRHRHRDRRHAARHLPGRQPRRPAARTSPARRRSRAGSAPPRACRSAPKACSCSAATASSRSTRSSAGTETSEQRA